MKKTFLFIAIFLLFSPFLSAQFVEKDFSERRKRLEKEGESIVGFYPNDLALVKKSGKCGYIRADGKQITPFVYEKGYLFNREIALVKKAGKWGIIKENGQEIAPCVYQQIWENLEGRSSSQDFEENYYTRILHNGVFWAKKEGKWGLVDSLGKVLYPFEIEQIADTNRRNSCDACKFYFGKVFLMAAKKEGKWGMIDGIGKLVLPYQYKDIYVEKGFIFAQTEKEMCVFDSNLQLKYTSERFKEVNMELIQQGKYLFFLEKKSPESYVLYNEKQKKVWESPLHFEISIGENEDSSFFKIKTKKGIGLLDTNFQEILKPEYDYIYFSSDAIFAIKDGLIGIFSLTGKEILPFIYQSLDHKNQGITLKYKGKIALFDPKTNHFILPFQAKYHSINYFSETKEFLVTSFDSTRIVAETNEKSDYTNYGGGITKTYCANISHPEVMALMDSNFRPILPPIYDKISYNKLAKYYVLTQNKKGYTVLDSNKNIVFHFDSLKGNHFFYKEGKMGIYSSNLLYKYHTLYQNISILPCGFYNFMATKDSIHFGIIDNNSIEKQPFIFEKIEASRRFVYAYIKNKIYIFDENIQLLAIFPQKDNKNLMGLSFVSWTKNKGKWGVKNKAGKIIVPFIYDKVQWVQNEEDTYIEEGRFHAFVFRSKPYNDTLERHFDIGFDITYDNDDFWYKLGIFDNKSNKNAHLVEKNGMVGIINMDKETILPFEYHLAWNEDAYGNTSHYLLAEHDTYQCFDAENKPILPPNTTDCKILADNLIAYRHEKLWGLMDKTGKILHQPQFDNLDEEAGWDNPFIEVKKGDKKDYLTKEGKVLGGFQYEYLWKTNNDYGKKNALYFAQKGNYFALMDTLWARELTDFQYLTNSIPVGVIDIDKDVWEHFKGEKRVLLRRIDSMYVVLNPYTLQEYPLAKHIDSYELSDSALLATTPHGWVLMGFNGKILLEKEGRLMLNAQKYFYGKHFIVKHDAPKTAYQCYHIRGNALLKETYDSLFFISNYIAAIQQGKIGLFDSLGKQVLPFEYESIQKMEADIPLFLVKKMGKYGIINAKNELLIPCEYAQISNKVIANKVVVKNDLCAVLTLENQLVTPFQYKGLKILNDSFFTFQHDCLFGLLDKTGHVFLPDAFTDIELIIDNRYMVAHKGGNYLIVSILTGQVLNFFESTNYEVGEDKNRYNLPENIKAFLFKNPYNHSPIITDKYLIYNMLKHEWVNIPTLFKEVTTTLYGTLKLTTYDNQDIHLNKLGEQILFSEKDSMQYYRYNKQYQIVLNPRKEYALISENQHFIFAWDTTRINLFEIKDKSGDYIYYALRGLELFCMNTQEKTTLAYHLQAVMDCNNQYIWAKYQNKWGLFDMIFTKSWIISPRFDELESTNRYDRFPVIQNGKRYIVDTKYQIIVDELEEY